MKRYCQTLDLKEDEQLIKEYCYWHSPEHIWPEIPEGIRAVGILNMEIYRLGLRGEVSESRSGKLLVGEMAVNGMYV